MGVTLAFVMECYEQGILTVKTCDGLEPTWGNAEAIIALVEKIAKREGIGELLADGVKRAAERIGAGSQEFAMHVGGQELPLHDARYEPILGLAYQVDATPARHTSANSGIYRLRSLEEFFSAAGAPMTDRYEYQDKGKTLAALFKCLHVVSCAGLCQFILRMGTPPVRQWINAVTGWELCNEELLQIGYRIQTLRQAFNLREGIKPEEFVLPDRAMGKPPLDKGPLRNVSLDMDTMVRDYFEAMDWDATKGIPSKRSLESLNLHKVIEDLYT